VPKTPPTPPTPCAPPLRTATTGNNVRLSYGTYWYRARTWAAGYAEMNQVDLASAGDASYPTIETRLSFRIDPRYGAGGFRCGTNVMPGAVFQYFLLSGDCTC
jgi:hypothetical protein